MTVCATMHHPDMWRPGSALPPVDSRHLPQIKDHDCKYLLLRVINLVGKSYFSSISELRNKPTIPVLEKENGIHPSKTQKKGDRLFIDTQFQHKDKRTKS